MTVVDAAADRVTLNNLDTHRDSSCGFFRDLLSRHWSRGSLIIIVPVRGRPGIKEAAVKRKERITKTNRKWICGSLL